MPDPDSGIFQGIFILWLRDGAFLLGPRRLQGVSQTPRPQLKAGPVWRALPHSPPCDLGFQCLHLSATLRQRPQVTLQSCHTSVPSYKIMSECPRVEMGDTLTSLNRSMESPSSKAREVVGKGMRGSLSSANTRIWKSLASRTISIL